MKNGQTKRGSKLTATKAAPDDLGDVTIVLKVKEVEASAYETRHVDVTSLSDRRARAMKHLTLGMMGAPMSDGKPVRTSADVVRWILDQVATRCEDGGARTVKVSR